MDIKNCLTILLILLAFGIFSSGCAESGQNVKDECPECGTVFRNHISPGSRY
jgi:hypothetical protein